GVSLGTPTGCAADRLGRLQLSDPVRAEPVQDTQVGQTLSRGTTARSLGNFQTFWENYSGINSSVRSFDPERCFRTADCSCLKFIEESTFNLTDVKINDPV